MRTVQTFDMQPLRNHFTFFGLSLENLRSTLSKSPLSSVPSCVNLTYFMRPCFSNSTMPRFLKISNNFTVCEYVQSVSFARTETYFGPLPIFIFSSSRTGFFLRNNSSISIFALIVTPIDARQIDAKQMDARSASFGLNVGLFLRQSVCKNMFSPI